MFSDQTAKRCAEYVLERTRHVIESFGPRTPGSAAERQTQELICEELRETCDNEPAMDPFPVAPKAFMSFQPLVAMLLIGAFVAYRVNPIVAAGLSALGFFIFFAQLGRYWRLLDVFFPKKTSWNVSATQKPGGKAKRRIVLNAHPDAAYEWRYSYLFPKQAPFIVLYLMSAPLIKMVTDVGCALVHGSVPPEPDSFWGIVGVVQLIAVPAVIGAFFFTNFKVTVPGANDNLTGCFVATGVLKYLKESNRQLSNTELMVLVTGSEEAGLRGSKAWAESYADTVSDMETIFITLETFRDIEHLAIMSRDLHGTVPHDAAVCRLLKNAGDACGRDLPYRSIPVGSTDATAFTQKGLRAAAVAAMDPNNLDWYHTRRDNFDNMDAHCVQAAVQWIAEAVRQYDENGLPAAS